MEETVSKARRLADLGRYDDATGSLRQALVAAEGLDRLPLVIELATILRNQGFVKASFDALEHEIRFTSEANMGHPFFLQVQMDALLLRPLVLASFKGVCDQAAGVFQRLLEL